MSAMPIPGAAPSRAPAEPQRYGLAPKHACADAYLSDNAHRVLTALGILAAGRGEAWATVEEIGGAAGGKSPSTVRRALRELESRGYITRDVIARNFSFNFTLRGRATPAVVPMPARPLPAAPEPAPEARAPRPAGPACTQAELPDFGPATPVRSDTPPLPDLTGGGLSDLTPPPAGALEEAPASEESGERSKKIYLPNPTPSAFPRAHAHAREAGRRPINPFPDAPPEVVEKDPILRAEAMRRSGGGRVAS